MEKKSSTWKKRELKRRKRRGALEEDAKDGSNEAKEMLKIIETEMITITEAAPTLDIKEKKKKWKEWSSSEMLWFSFTRDFC